MSRILYEKSNGVGSITLNYPEKLNCLDEQMLNDILSAVQDANVDDAIRVVTFEGAGDRAFCSGANLKAFKALDEKGIDRWIRLGHQVFNEIEQIRCPTVAILHGYVMGGGLELAMACDLRVAQVDTKCSLPELQHGWIPGWGGIARLKRLVGESNAKRLILLSQEIDVQKALQMGLLHQVFEAKDRSRSIDEILDQLTSIDPTAMSAAKQLLNNEYTGTDANRQQLEVKLTQQLRSRS